MKQTRRTLLTGSVALLVGSATAGCLDESESTVTVLAESVGGHDHDDDHDHDHSLGSGGDFLDGDDHHDDHDYHHEGLTEEEISHACGHMEFDESEPLDGATDHDEAPHVSETHQPFEVTFAGDTGYIIFEAEDDHHHDHSFGADSGFLNGDDHDHDGEMFAFFSETGDITIHEGHHVYDEHGVEACGDIGMYVIAEPDHGEIVLEVAADN